MKYICTNPNCDNYQKVDFYRKETFRFQGGKLIGVNCICPKCKEVRQEFVEPEDNVPLSQKNVSINTMGALSMEQRREILKKRSHDHFKKEIKERKDGLLNAAMSEMNKFRSGKL